MNLVFIERDFRRCWNHLYMNRYMQGKCTMPSVRQVACPLIISWCGAIGKLMIVIRFSVNGNWGLFGNHLEIEARQTIPPCGQYDSVWMLDGIGNGGGICSRAGICKGREERLACENNAMVWLPVTITHAAIYYSGSRNVNLYRKAVMESGEISRECTHSSLTTSIEMIKSSL